MNVNTIKAASSKSNSTSSKSSKTSKSNSSKSKEKEAEKPKKDEEPTTETITVSDEDLECTIDRISKTSARWICSKVPFEGYVRVRLPNRNEDFLAYGRGE